MANELTTLTAQQEIAEATRKIAELEAALAAAKDFQFYKAAATIQVQLEAAQKDLEHLVVDIEYEETHWH